MLFPEKVAEESIVESSIIVESLAGGRDEGEMNRNWGKGKTILLHFFFRGVCFCRAMIGLNNLNERNCCLKKFES